MINKITRELVSTYKVIVGAIVSLRNDRVKKVDSKEIVYLDLGLHTDAEQLRSVVQWFGHIDKFRAFGFEANPDHFSKVADQEWPLCVSLVNMALVGPDHDGDTIDFYVESNGKGLGDSIFKEKSRSYEFDKITVPCGKLSDFFKQNSIDLASQKVLLRMNIEGAELFVLQDMASNGLIKLIDGFYGSWSDCAKISKSYGEALAELKTANQIFNIQFNRSEFRGFLSTVRRSLVKAHMAMILKS